MNTTHCDQTNAVPEWHLEELARRLARLKAGLEPMMPLAQAKILLFQDIAQRKATRAANLNNSAQV
jgi:hypothetical protein